MTTHSTSTVHAHDPAPAPISPAHDPHGRVERCGVTTLPTVHGEFSALAYRDHDMNVDHMALMVERPGGVSSDEPPLVRVHSECLTGEAFGSVKCECGPQLDAALALIQEHGGVVIYLRGQEGRGIGLANKIRAYELQERGVDTLDANLQLGFPADARDYTAAALMLQDLDITRIRLLSNNPEKGAQLERHGITVSDHVPLVVGVGDHNRDYLATKRDRMGHTLPTAV